MAEQPDIVKFKMWDIRRGDIVRLNTTNELAVVVSTEGNDSLRLFEYIEVFVFRRRRNEEILKHYIDVISAV
jgi:hypothetical protein